VRIGWEPSTAKWPKEDQGGRRIVVYK
jgi:hypothetical protein